MAMRMQFRISFSCKRHPRYDPAKGEAGIKGGCEECREILAGYQRVTAAIEEMATKIPGVKITRGKAMARW